MAHLAPHLQHHNQHHQHPPTAAIFSPSVARAAASTAKDWAYVDDWLHRRYASSSADGGSKKRSKPPAFERNPDTLRALLALAAANEAADEERAQLLRIEEAALGEEKRQQQQQQEQEQQKQQTQKEDEDTDGQNTAAQVTTGLLTALEEGLTREGRAALDAMALMATELGEAAPTPLNLAASFVELQGRLYEAEIAAKRVGLLQDYLRGETTQIEILLKKIRRHTNHPSNNPTNPTNPIPVGPPPHHHQHPEDSDDVDVVDPEDDDEEQETDLARRNLDLHRAVKAALARLPELEQQVEAVERAVAGEPTLTVSDVAADEAAYEPLLARKRELDAAVAEFAGLPPDVEAARAELEAFRRELRERTERRDEYFERLVERESPVKTRGAAAGRRREGFD